MCAGGDSDSWTGAALGALEEEPSEGPGSGQLAVILAGDSNYFIGQLKKTVTVKALETFRVRKEKSRALVRTMG